MKVFGQLERAQAENLGSAPSAGVKGRIYFDTVGGLLKCDDGTNIQTLIFSGVAQIVNADINASAAIARTKLASGTVSHVLINDVSGVMSSEATLAKSRGGSAQDNSSLTFPSTGTLATLAGAEIITNKDHDGGTASNTSRLTAPKAAKATLTALTRKAGTIAYASDELKLYFDNGTTLIKLTDITTTADDIGAAMTSTGANAVAATMTATGANAIINTVTRLTATPATAGNILITASSGSYTNTNTSYTNVTNMSGNLTTTGKPVKIYFVPSGSGAAFLSISTNAPAGSLSVFGKIQILRAGVTVIGQIELGMFLLPTSGTMNTGTAIEYPPGAIFFIDDNAGAGLAAATYTYSAQSLASGSSASSIISIFNCRMVAEEMR